MRLTFDSTNMPDADQVHAHLTRHTPVPPPRWPVFVTLGVFVFSLIIAAMSSSPVAVLLPWIVAGAVVAILTVRATQIRQIDRQLERIDAAIMLRHHEQVVTNAWNLIPKLTHRGDWMGRASMAMGIAMEDLRAYDAAQTVFSVLLDWLDQNHPMRDPIQLHWTLSALQNGQLADADAMIRRLASSGAVEPGSPGSAMFYLIKLLQDVRTGHAREAMDEMDDPVATLRPLGVEAGLGYGLLAWCCLQRARFDDTEQRGDWLTQMRAWWDKAVLLLPASAMVWFAHELSDLAQLDQPGDELEVVE